MSSNNKIYGAYISGTGSFVPDKILTNEELSRMVDTSDEWITTRTGIKERRIANENETTAYLSVEACRKAMEMAELGPEDIGAVIVGTITPEMVFPSTGCFVQQALGLKNAFAFDLQAACSGFLYSLSVAEAFVKMGKYNNILVLGAETLSTIVDYNERTSCILFGDGAGAAVVSRDEDTSRGVLYTNCGSDGGGWESLYCKAYGSRYPVCRPLEDETDKFMKLQGREVYQLAVRTIVDEFNLCLKSHDLDKSQIKMIIPHQMNARIIESSSKRLGLSEDQVYINIAKYGNTSAASIPIALDECVREGILTKGDYSILIAFGAGLTWASALIKF
jgi:3-oxoacyl-[acyl-carrier-protein] synthase III